MLSCAIKHEGHINATSVSNLVLYMYIPSKCSTVEKHLLSREYYQQTSVLQLGEHENYILF